MTACPKKFGSYAVCGVPLEMTTVDGRLVQFCWACDRLKRGICRECPLPVDGQVGKTRRCAAHQKVEESAWSARYRKRNPEKHRYSARVHMRKPEVRARNLANIQKWRKANPEKVRQQRKRRELRQYRALRGAAA